MADALQSKRDNALEFLDELDGKHDYLLTELDSLNVRLDTILAEYAKSRQAVAGFSGAQVSPNLPAAEREAIASQAESEHASTPLPPANPDQPLKSTQFNADSCR